MAARSTIQNTSASGHKSGSRVDGRAIAPHPKEALRGILNLEGGVYQDRTEETLPPVLHEFVQPIVHTQIIEHITREVHTHDVFHRVLPVIDLEILPTKHYVVDPTNPGTLREISASEAPQNNSWSITHNVVPGTHSTSARNATSGHSISNLLHNAHIREAPVLSSKKSYMTKEGHMKTEYVWRHPPTLDWSAYDRGETVPLRMNCMSEAQFADVMIGEPNHAKATADRGISSSDGTYGHGREVAGLQKHAHASLLDQRAVFHTPTPSARVVANAAIDGIPSANDRASPRAVDRSAATAARTSTSAEQTAYSQHGGHVNSVEEAAHNIENVKFGVMTDHHR